MSIIYDNSLKNEGNTPAAITGVIANIPAAANVTEGTLYISTDTQEIFSAQAGSWVKVSGSGGGGSQNLQQVLSVFPAGEALPNQQIYWASVGGFSQSYTKEGLRVGINNNQNIFSRVTSLNSAIALRHNYNGGTKTIDIVSGQANNITMDYVHSQGQNKIRLLTDVANTLFELENTNNILPNFYFSINLDQTVYPNGPNLTASDATNNNYFYLQLLSTVKGTVYCTVPSWNGILANVNERIVNSGINLSSATFFCNEFGAYHVKTGSNTNDFDMSNFLSAGQDGEFVTIMAEDTPIRCEPSADIIGTATINSKGLFKIMKFGTKLYTSHL